MPILLRPLRQRTFALLWGATLLSNLGFWVQDITLSWLIAGLTHSPSLVAMVPAAAMLPIFLFSLPAGAFGDSVDRRKFLITVQVLLVLLLVGFALIVGTGRTTIFLLVGFAFVHGTLAAVSSPTRQAILPAVVERENVRGAVLLSAIGYNGSRAVGPMLGGLTLAYFGSVAAILVYAASCLVVGLALYRWKHRPEPPQQRHLLALSQEGIRYVWQQPHLRRALTLTTIYFLSVAPLWAFAPLVAKSYAAGNSKIFALFMMALGLGAVVGGLNRRLTINSRFEVILSIGSALSALALATIGLSHSVVLALLGYFIAGLGWIGVSAGINSYILLEATSEFHSRAISIVLVVFSGGLGIGSLLWGQVGQRITLPPTFLVASGALFLLSGFALVGRSQGEAASA